MNKRLRDLIEASCCFQAAEALDGEITVDKHLEIKEKIFPSLRAAIVCMENGDTKITTVLDQLIVSVLSI